MTPPNTTSISRMIWLLAGVAAGAMGLGAVWWATGRVTPSPTQGAMSPPSMEMGGGRAGADGAMAMNTESIRITPAQIRQFGVTFGTSEERLLESRIRAVGVVEVDETRVVEITTKFPGYVERLFADFTGTAVEAGAPLLDVYAPDLVAAQDEILLARDLRTTVGQIRVPGTTSAPVDLEATARRRLSLWDIGEDQIDSLLVSGRPSRTMSLRSPISGVVLEKSVVSGAAFQAGQMLLRLADLSAVWIEVEIRESDAARVGRGSRAEVTLTAYPGEAFGGVVDFVYPTVDERTRAVRARVVVSNVDGRIRPGMYATVEVTTPEMRALSVPLDAVVRTGERSLVFVADEGGMIRPVEADFGATIGDHVVVLAGLEAGQRVVASAQYLIDAEANIGAIMRSMMSMMGAGDMADMDMRAMDMGAGEMDGMDTMPEASPADTTGGR